MNKNIKWIIIGLLFFMPAIYFYITKCYTCIWLFIFPILFIPIGIWFIFNSVFNLIFIWKDKNSKNLYKLTMIKYIILLLCICILEIFLYLEDINIIDFIIFPLIWFLFIIIIYNYINHKKEVDEDSKIIEL